MKSLKQVVNDIKEFCESHPQINHFNYGEFENSGDKNIFKPIMVIVYPESATATEYILDIYVFDKPNEDDFDLLEVDSKTLEVAQDIVTHFTNNPEKQYQYQVDASNISPVTNDTGDALNGWQLALTLRQFNPQNDCLLP
jgi:hypothetical protein